MATPINQVIYDGFDFVANGLVLTNVDYMTQAPRMNQIELIANRNGGVLVQSQLGTKPILIEGYYNGASVVDAQNMYDMLAAAVNRQERDLIVPHAGGTRKFTATPENVIIQEPDGLNRLTFSINFVVPKGKAEDATTTTAISTTVTTANATIPLTILGSAKARPLITLSFTALTGGTSKTLTIRNGRDLVGLNFTRTFVAGDTITIDSANFQIYINGVLTAPSGRFPSWESGTGSLYYSDTMTTRSVNVTMTYKRGNN